MANHKKSYSYSFHFTDYVCDVGLYETLAKDSITYLIAGRELCPTTGREHWQSFISFKNQRSVQAVREMLHPRNCDKARKCDLAGFRYCAKDGNIVYEAGTRPTGQGHRSDLNAMRDAIINGETNSNALVLTNPEQYHQYGRTIERIQGLANQRRYRTWMTEGIWYYGTAGSGKSHAAFEGFDPATHFVWTDDNGWWDGYDGHEVVIMNDFRGGVNYSKLLALVDKWPEFVPQRHRGPIPFLAKKVIITSVLSPSEVFPDLTLNDTLDQLERRFQIINLTPK